MVRTISLREAGRGAHPTHNNPATLARDVKKIVQKGYHLDSVTPFDLFPQTGHVESISILVRE